MPVSVNPIRNDAEDRNVQILGAALGLARDVYKVNMDEKAAAKAAEVTQQRQKEALTAEDKQRQFQAEEKEKDRQAQKEIALAKMKASAEESEKDRRLKAAALRPPGPDGKYASNKPTNEGEKTSALYGRRMQNADQILSSMETNPDVGLTDLSTGVGNMLLPDSMRSKEIQLYNNAKNNFITAVLRKESGAAISDSEFEKADKLYFAQPGDAPEVVAQKQALRSQVIGDFKMAAGRAWSDDVGGGEKPKTETVKLSNGQAVTREQILEELARRQKGTASK